MSFSSSFTNMVRGLHAIDDAKRQREEYDAERAERDRLKEQNTMYRGLSSDMSAYGYPEATKYKALSSQAAAYGDLDMQKKFDDYRKMLEAEGIANTIKYLKSGDNKRALEEFNNTGGIRLKDIGIDPSDENKVVFTTPDGDVDTYDIRRLEARTMDGLTALQAERAARIKAGDRDHDINKIRVKGDEDRKTEAFKNKSTGSGLLTPSQMTARFNMGKRVIDSALAADLMPLDDKEMYLRLQDRTQQYISKGQLPAQAAVAAYEEVTGQKIDENARNKLEASIEQQVKAEAEDKDAWYNVGGVADESIYDGKTREQWIEDEKKSRLSNTGQGLPGVPGGLRAPDMASPSNNMIPKDPNLQKAMQAIGKGADRAAVFQRLKEAGYTDQQLSEL